VQIWQTMHCVSQPCDSQLSLNAIFSNSLELPVAIIGSLWT
jgi:hypothetical protein